MVALCVTAERPLSLHPPPLSLSLSVLQAVNPSGERSATRVLLQRTGNDHYLYRKTSNTSSGGATLWQSSANALPVCCHALPVALPVF